MKKEYMKPSAEKVVFDYAENVTANSCFNWGGCNNGNNGGNGNSSSNTGLHQENGVWYYNDQKVNSDPYGGWACRSTDHHDCYQF